MTNIRNRRSHPKDGNAMNGQSHEHLVQESKPLKGNDHAERYTNAERSAEPRMATKASIKMKAVQFIWCLHFFFGFLVVYAGIVKNGGDRKYVRLDPSRIKPSCSKAFANVHSSSIDEPYALVCCTNDEDRDSILSHGIWDFLSSHTGSYEAALCSDKVGSVFGMSLTSFPMAWILPLIPLVLRMIIISYQRILHNVPCRNNGNAWGARTRFILYFFIMNFRGWALYLLLNNLEDAIVEWTSSPYFNNPIDSSVAAEPRSNQATLQATESQSCWYQDYLYYEGQRAKACYGQEFDFSDHVVLFFGQILPVAIFEVLFCILVPLWNTTVPTTNETNASTKKENKKSQDETSMLVGTSERNGQTDSRNAREGGNPNARCGTWETLIGYAAQLLLFIGFVYLNAMTFMAVHHTAAYFHTAGEVMVGYVVSLFVQLPLGYLILHRPSSHSTTLTSAAHHMESERPADVSHGHKRRISVANRIRVLIGFPQHHQESPQSHSE